MNGGSPFTGTGVMVRLALRRDRVLVPAWIAVFALSAYYTASATLTLYPTVSAMRSFSLGVNDSTALVALYGPIWNVDSLGAGCILKISAMGAALVAVLLTILTVRHTRAEEEAGRAELVASAVVGRLAGLTAALVVSGITALLLGVLSAVALVAAGLPIGGSVAFGLSWATSGLVFTAIAGLTAQLSTSARVATGSTLAVLGASYLVRAAGDASRGRGAGWVSWISPIGWAEQLRPFAGDRWWALLPGLALTALGVAAAATIAARRDLGAGVWADRTGPGAAGPLLRGPFVLAFRLQRGVLAAWTVAYLVLGPVMGSMAGNLGSMVNGSSAQMITRMGGEHVLIDAYFSVELSFMAMIASSFAVQTITRLRAEESALHAEALLATALSRRRWMGAYLAVAALGSLWLLLVGGLGAGAAGALSLHQGSQFGRLVVASIGQLPALCVVAGITAAVFGLAPRLIAAGWAALVAFVLLGELGPLLRLDHRLIDLSPFVHSPRPGSVAALPLLVLTVIAVALGVLGLETFRRRDLQ